MQKRSVFLLSFLVSFSRLVCMDLVPVMDDDDKHDYSWNPSASLSRASRLSTAALLTGSLSDNFDDADQRSDNRLAQALQKDVRSGKLNQESLRFIVDNLSSSPLGFYNLDPTNKTFCTWDRGKIVALNYELKQVHKVSCADASGSVICSPISPSKRPTIVALEYLPEKDIRLNREYQARVEGSSTAIKIWRPTWLGSDWNQYHCESKIQLKPIGSRLSTGGSRLVLFFDRSVEIFRTDNPADPPFRFDVTKSADHLKIKSSYIKFYQSQVIGNRKVGTKKNIEIMLVPADKTDRTDERQKVHILWNLLDQCYTCDSPLLEQVTESEPIKYIYNPPRKIKRATTVVDATTAATIESLKEEKQRLEAQLADQKLDGDQLQTTLDTTEADLQLAGKTVGALSRENGRLEAQVTNLKAQLADASRVQSDKLAEFAAQLEAATSATTEHQKRVEALEEELRQAQAAQTELERAQAELKTAQARVTELAKEKDESDSELQSARAKVTELERRVNELQAQAARIDKLQQELDATRREYTALRQSGTDQEAMARQLSMITSLIESQQTEEGERTRLEELIIQKDKELAQLRKELDTLIDQTADAQAQSALLERKAQKLKEEQAKLDANKRQLEELVQAEERKLGKRREQDLESVRAEVQQEQQEWLAGEQAGLQQREEGLEQRMEDLKVLHKSRLESLERQKKDALADKDAEIARLTAELEESHSGQSSALDKDLQRREGELNQRERELEEWAENRQKELEDWADRETKRLKAEIEEERKAQKKEQKIWAQRKEVEFREQDEELKHKEQQLAKDRSIHVSEVNQKEIQFNAWQDRLVAHQETLAQEDANLAKKTRETEADLKQQAIDLDDREERLNEQKAKLETRRASLALREKEVQKREETLSRRITEANTKSGGAVGLQAIIEQRDETITDLQQQLAGLRAQLELQQAGTAASPAADSTNETAQQVVELQQTIGQRDATITALESTLTDKDATIRHLEGQLTRLSTQLSQLQQLDEPAASPTAGNTSDTDSVASSAGRPARSQRVRKSAGKKATSLTSSATKKRLGPAWR